MRTCPNIYEIGMREINRKRGRENLQAVFTDTVKALLSPGGAYLLFAVLEGGLNREGGLLERGGLL